MSSTVVAPCLVVILSFVSALASGKVDLVRLVFLGVDELGSCGWSATFEWGAFRGRVLLSVPALWKGGGFFAVDTGVAPGEVEAKSDALVSVT